MFHLLIQLNSIQNNLGTVYSKMGENEEAWKLYEIVLDKAPSLIHQKGFSHKLNGCLVGLIDLFENHSQD